MDSDLHPFVLTKKTMITLMDSLEHGPPSDRCDDCHAWYDCCWMCVPCSIAVDVVICLPMTGICIYNKTKDKCKCKPKKDNWKDGEKDVKNDKTEIKKGEKIISSSPTALENPNFYENK